jgi:hypothetical protein
LLHVEILCKGITLHNDESLPGFTFVLVFGLLPEDILRDNFAFKVRTRFLILVNCCSQLLFAAIIRSISRLQIKSLFFFKKFASKQAAAGVTRTKT